MRAPVGRCGARGQAMVETLVALLVVVPLWIGIFYVSRWHDLQHAAIAAARHAAFETWVAAGTVDPAQVEALTRRRIFSDDPARFVAAAPGAAQAGEARPLWQDSRGARLVAAPGPSVAVGRTAQPEEVAEAERFAFGLIGPARSLGGPPFDLQRDAARGVTVTVPVAHAADLPAPIGGLRFDLVERRQLLVDPWASAAPVQVERRTAALSTSAALQALVRPLEPLRWAVSTVEPAFARLCLGRIESDVVPEDRVRGARSILDLRQRPC